MFSKIMAVLDGKKTAIGLLLLYGPDVLQKISEIVQQFAGGEGHAVAFVGGVTVAIGLLHKAAKLIKEFGIDLKD